MKYGLSQAGTQVWISAWDNYKKHKNNKLIYTLLTSNCKHVLFWAEIVIYKSPIKHCEKDRNKLRKTAEYKCLEYGK